jgi:adenylosuccinate lyase
MATRMSDSEMYAHLWTSPGLDEWFSERGRLTLWLDILRALATAQGDLGIIPSAAADHLATLTAVDLDLALVAEHTRRTSHSTLGLIHGLQAALPDEVAQYAYYGATVQDVSDTWFGMVMRDVGCQVRRGLDDVYVALVMLSREHRDTLMVGRTHGQPGSPITFGFKAASWADEIGRHLDRLQDGRRRWEVGQLAGAVGVLGFFGQQGTDLRAHFCTELGLHDPGISWTSSRDRIADFGGTLAMICATLARMGNEVYELQRPEIGELSEPPIEGGVGSITMPHKRNPERSEHLATLSRLARAQAGVLLEGMEHQHERDGRAWKAEWIALPELCELTAVAVGLAQQLFGALGVHPERMAQNLAAAGIGPRSEQVLSALSSRIGKHRAQALLQETFVSATRAGSRVEVAELEMGELLTSNGVPEDEVRRLLTTYQTGVAGAMVDAVGGSRRSHD